MSAVSRDVGFTDRKSASVNGKDSRIGSVEIGVFTIAVTGL